MNIIIKIYYKIFPECNTNLDCGNYNQCYCNKCEAVELRTSKRKFPKLSFGDMLRNRLLKIGVPLKTILKYWPYKGMYVSESYRLRESLKQKPINIEF